MSSPVLSYSFPKYSPQVSANNESWVSTSPSNGSVFRSNTGSSIILQLGSNTAFVKTVQSFLHFTVTCRDGAGNAVTPATTRNSYQGISRLWSRVVIRVGSAITEDLDYSDLCALYYATVTAGKKALLTKTEGFSNTSIFATAGTKTFCEQLITSIFVTDQAVPLPLFLQNAGFSIELFIAPLENLLTVSTGISYLELSNVSLKYQTVTPDASFTTALVSSVRSGREAIIPLQVVRSFQSNGNASTKQNIVCAVGGVKSVAGIDVVFYDDTVMGNQAADKYLRFLPASLTDYRIEAAGISSPAILNFTGAEAAMMNILSSTGNGFIAGDQTSLDATYETSSWRITHQYTSDAELFGSGLDMTNAANPNITIQTTHGIAVPSTMRIVTYVTIDCLLIISGSFVQIAYTW